MAPKKTGRKPKRVTFGRPFESKKKPAAAIDCKTGEPVVAAPEPEISTPGVATVATEVKNFMVAAAAGEDKEVVKRDAIVDCELGNAAAALQECGLCDDTRDCPIPVVVSTTDELTRQQAELDEAAAALREAGFCHTDGVATLEDDTEDRGSLATLQVGRAPQWMPLSACWLKRIPGDGNCFFSALSDQLQGTALEMNADNLRQTLAVELENWIDSAENDTGISEAEWRDLLEKTKRKGEYVSDHVASAAARLLGIEIYVYQDMGAGSNLEGIYLGPVGVEPRATVRLHFNRQGEHYQSVHVRQSSHLAAVDDGAAKMMPPPPPPPAIPMQSVAQKVQEWKEVKCNRRACKRVPGAAATDVDNKFSIRVDENRFNVLWNVDLDADEEEPTLSVCSGDDSTSKVSSSVSRRSRRNRSVPSCPTRRSSRLSAKACSSSNASVLSSAEASDSCASSVVRRRKRVVKPGSPTRRSERLLAKKRRMEEGDDASSVGTSNLSSIGAAAESDKVSCIAEEEEVELASVALEESKDHQRPTKTKTRQREGQNVQSESRSSPRKKASNEQSIPDTGLEASPTKCRRKPDNLEEGRSSPRKKAHIEQQQQQPRVEIESEVPEIQHVAEEEPNSDFEEQNASNISLPQCLRNPFTKQYKKMRNEFFQECTSRLSNLKRCLVCKERFPCVYFQRQSDASCQRCVKDNSKPKLFSDENNANPMCEQPEELRDLSVAEQMLISPILSVIVVYRLFPQGQHASRGHGIMFPQDQASVVRELPRRTLPVVLMYDKKLQNNPGSTVTGAMNNLRVRRDKVLNAIRYLINNNQYFQRFSVGIDREALNSLPENGYAQQINEMVNQMDTQDVNVDLDAAEEEARQPDEDEQRQQMEEAQLEETTSALLNTPLRRLEVKIRDRLLEEKLQWPRSSRVPVNEFEQEGLFSLAYPHLFPDGKGDYKTPRVRSIGLGDYAKHLMQFHCPRFRCDPRFRFFIENMVMRWRALEVGRVFVHDKNLAGLSAPEMLEKLKDPAVMSSVSARASELRGTASYWQSKRRQLEAMIKTIGLPHYFVTLSAADIQWPELLQKFFVEHWKVKDFWFRIEYQSRGSPHVHGCVWMPDGVDVTSESLQAEDLVAFVDKYICSWNTCMDESDSGREILSGGVGAQPARLKPSEIKDDKADLQALLHNNMRHSRCSNRCLRKEKNGSMKCRYKYPRDLQTKTVAKKLSSLNWKVETQRNDQYIGMYNPQVLCMWRANLDIQMISSAKDLIRYLIKYASKGEKESEQLQELNRRYLSMEQQQQESVDIDNAAENDNNQQQHDEYSRTNTARRIVQQHLMMQVGARDYSAQEAMHLVLQTPMYKASREFVYVQTGETRAIESRGVCKNSIEKYANRPAQLENETMYRFFSDYIPPMRQQRRGGEQVAVYKKRLAGKEAVLIVSPFLRSTESDDKRREQYYRQQVLLWSCWRTEEQAKGSHASWREAYEAMMQTEACQLVVRDLDDLRNDEADEEEREAVADLPDMTAANAESVAGPAYPERQQEDWMAALGAKHADIQLNVNKNPEDTLPVAPEGFDWSAASDWQFPSLAEAKQFLMTELTKPVRRVAGITIEDGAGANRQTIDVSLLNERQRKLYDMIDNQLKLERLAESDTTNNSTESGKMPPPLRVILYGSAGTGKSFLIAALRKLIGEDKCKVMAPTGVAAFNIAGETLHSALKLNVKFSTTACTTNADGSTTSGSSKALSDMQSVWSNVRYIIIDEFSMVGQRTLAKVHNRLCELFPEEKRDTLEEGYFGGRSIILVGDVFQLPPVQDKQLYVFNKNAKDNLTPIGYQVYQSFKTVVYLNKQVRQANDTEFASILESLREGKVTEAIWKTVMDKCQVAAADMLPLDVDGKCTLLYHTNEDVSNANCEELRKIVDDNNPVRIINATCTGRQPLIGNNAADSSKQKSETGLARRLFLAIGARVMLTRNLSVQNGLVNGSVGTVRGICYANGKKPPNDLPDCVWVEFERYNGPANASHAAAREDVSSQWLQRGASLSRHQFPLRLAWAITIHKSQGLTIDKAFVQLGKGRKSPPAGLYYTAVSRVRAFV
uniref:ATP-dependent DNA helicase n=2 Tax=Macrostomum lignano TaxID=282301 RepID=A0A1I8H6W3_9PLAT